MGSDAVEDSLTIELGRKKRATVRPFKNMMLLDIREFYEKDDEWLPGRKGISLTRDQWKVLNENAELISNALDGVHPPKRPKSDKEPAEEPAEESGQPTKVRKVEAAPATKQRSADKVGPDDLAADVGYQDTE